MTAASASRVVRGRHHAGKPIIQLAMKASARVYRNTLAFLDTADSGLVKQYAGYSGGSNFGATAKFMGIHTLEVYNLDTALANLRGDKAQVAQDGDLELVFNGTATDADLGKPVYAIDDQTVQLSGSSAIYVGKIVKVFSATSVLISVDTDQSAAVLS